MRVHIGGDHAAYDLHQELVGFLEAEGHEVSDHGPFELDPQDDYPVFVLRAAEGVAADPGSLGIVLGGSGNGEQMAANKVPGVRAALCYNEELARLARQRDLDPAFGHSTEYERNVPFGVFAEIFARFDRAPALDEQHQAALRVVLTGAQSAPLPGSTGLERYRMHRALRQTLLAAAKTPGLLLVLDDLHWADEASLELLEHLLDEPHALLVVAVAYRTGQAPPKLAAALARTRMATTRIELDRLAAGDAPVNVVART